MLCAEIALESDVLSARFRQNSANPYSVPKRRIEIFTETNAVSIASAVQIAADSIPALNRDGTEGTDMEKWVALVPPSSAMALMIATRTSASTATPTTKPGNARRQG